MKGLHMSRHLHVLAFAAFATVALATVASASQMDQLVGAIAGGDEIARSEARQLLPRYGVEPLPNLLPLLSHENQSVSAAAYNTIEDIVNEAGAPGREEQRVVARDLLLAEMDGASPQLTRKLMRLLPFALAEGDDVSAIARLLDDPDMREDARAALLHAGTHESAKALLAKLSKADATFACAVLDALAVIQEPAASMHLALMMENPDPQIRAAAAHALTWTGDASLERAFRAVAANATPETKWNATQALVQYADAMAARGGNWDRAIALYVDMLAGSDIPVFKAAAMTGLGRHGDERAVAPIADAVAQDPALAPIAVQALEALGGRGAAIAIAGAYPSFAPDMQETMLAMFGRRADAVLVEVLGKELQNTNADIRRAAISALGQTAQMDAFSALMVAAKDGPETDRAAALEAATAMAGRLGTSGDPAKAGQAYVQLFTSSSDPAAQRTALEGIAKYPVPAAYKPVMDALDGESSDLAKQALPGLAGALAAAGKNEEALTVFEKARSLDPNPDALIQLAQRLQGMNLPIDMSNLLGTLTTWHVAGPFPWKDDADWQRPFVNEPQVDLAAKYAVGDKEIGWKPVKTGDAIGTVNLLGELGQVDRAFGYAVTRIEAPQDMDAQIRVGSDDGNAVWVNGERVWENRVDRGMALDQDIVPCKLKKGKNEILIKVSQGAGGWCFCARVTAPDGAAAPFEVVE